MAHMYVHHISITIHFLLSTLLPFSWAGWLSSTCSVRNNASTCLMCPHTANCSLNGVL